MFWPENVLGRNLLENPVHGSAEEGGRENATLLNTGSSEEFIGQIIAYPDPGYSASWSAEIKCRMVSGTPTPLRDLHRACLSSESKVDFKST